jgi:hypothetical protein
MQQKSSHVHTEYFLDTGANNLHYRLIKARIEFYKCPLIHDMNDYSCKIIVPSCLTPTVIRKFALDMMLFSKVAVGAFVPENPSISLIPHGPSDNMVRDAIAFHQGVLASVLLAHHVLTVSSKW